MSVRSEMDILGLGIGTHPKVSLTHTFESVPNFFRSYCERNQWIWSDVCPCCCVLCRDRDRFFGCWGNERPKEIYTYSLPPSIDFDTT